MEIFRNGQKKTVKIGDTILLKSGQTAKVTGQIDGNSVITKTDTGDMDVVRSSDIVDIIVMVVKELGLVERFIAWLKRKLNPSV